MREAIIWGLMTVLMLCGFSLEGNAQWKNVREAAVAGQFYPGTNEALTAQVKKYLEAAEKHELEGPLHALIVPHAGYIYSGPIAAFAYKQITHPFKRVVIFASNHSPYADFEGISVPEYTHYLTPLGEVRVSPLSRTFIEKDDRISYIPAAHTTHIIEVQLPFLQLVLGNDFEILPVIIGKLDWDDVKHFGELFTHYADDDTLFIVSTDLSHYHPYDEAVKLDASCVNALERLDSSQVARAELCGQGAALIFLEIAKKQRWTGKILDYRNSGDTAGDKAKVVGYSAIAYYKAPPPSSLKYETEHYEKTAAHMSFADSEAKMDVLSAEEQLLLLELARTTIEQYIKEGTVFEPDEKVFSVFPKCVEPRGAFVTLKKYGKLRGCIGNLLGSQPLYLSVRDNAIRAAVRDSRFQPVTKDELAEIEVSVSVLNVPTLLMVNAPEEYPERLSHQDGVILICGNHRATYLPQVWEQLPDPVDFLGRLCLKGGADPECWKNPATQIYTYHAQKFGE